MLINYDKEELTAVDSRNYANTYIQLKLFTIRPPVGQKRMTIIKRWPLQRGSPLLHFTHEIKTKGNGIIGINIFLCMSIRMHKKGWDNSVLTILLIMLIAS